MTQHEQDRSGIDELLSNISLLEGQSGETKKKLDELRQTENSKLEDVLEEKFFGRSYSSEDIAVHKTEYLNRLKEIDDDDAKIVLYDKLDDNASFGTCGGLKFFKNPTSCGGCQKAEEIQEEVGIREYASYQGERVYSLTDVTIEGAKKNARRKLQDGNVQDHIDTLEKDVDVLEKKLKRFQDKVSLYHKLDAQGIDYEHVEKHLPGFFFKADGGKVMKIAYDKEHNTGVVLQDKSIDTGAGLEMGMNLFVFRDGQQDKMYFKYRDGFSSNGDNWSNFFDKADIQEVTDDQVVVGLYRGDDKRSVSVDMPAKEYEVQNFEVDGDFLERLEDVKNELVITSEKPNARMKDYMVRSNRFAQGNDVPYSQPQIFDQYVSLENNEAVVIVKSQIDHRAEAGRQFAWDAYLVTPGSTSLLERE